MTVHLCSAHHAPEHMKSPFIGAGYRVNYHWKACLKSIFRLHNETWNVWTHFGGFVIFAIFTIQLYVYAGQHEHAFDWAKHFHSHSLTGILEDVHAHNFTDSPHAWEFEDFAHAKILEMQNYMNDVKNQIQDQMDSAQLRMDIYFKKFEQSVHDLHNFHPHFPVTNFNAQMMQLRDQLASDFNTYIMPKSTLPLTIFLISAMVCFMGSAAFHTFGCHSQRAFFLLLKVDYSGISVLIAGSIVPFVCYTFHALEHWRYFYLTSLTVVSLVVIYVSFAERFSSNEYQLFRAGLFVLMACFFFMPLFHMLIVFGHMDGYARERLAVSGVLYLMGVLSYVLRLPERFFPGKFDVWLHSHQVFHMFIVAAAIMWYRFALRLWEVHAHTFNLNK